MLSVTLFYGATLAILLMALSVQVIRVRYRFQVALGDGDQKELKKAVRAQANFIEYVPITLLLIAILESRETPLWILHILGVMLLIGRCLHGVAINQSNLRWRFWGMMLTFLSLGGAILVSFASLMSIL